MRDNIHFNLDGFKLILDSAKENGYRVGPMKDYQKLSEGKSILLRHDVDVSLDTALELAQLEAKEGVTSTYYILLYNQFYNPLSQEGRELVQKIAALGHEIGLHWDSTFYPSDNPSELERLFKRDLEVLGEIAGQKVVSAAQHTPTVTQQIHIQRFIEIEAYAKDVMSKFRYVSDSNMQWRVDTPISLMSRGENFQFLSHPVLWARGDGGLVTKLENLCALEKIQTQKRYEGHIRMLFESLANREELDKRVIERD